MAEDISAKVRVAVAKRHDMNAKNLMKFADSELDEVRLAVVNNPNSKNKIFVKLAKDVCPEIREKVAQRTDNRDIRDELSYDEEEKVRLAVARGWGTGKRTLERMCRDDESLDVRLTARATVITWFKPPYHC